VEDVDRFQCPECNQWHRAETRWDFVRHRFTTWHNPVTTLRVQRQTDLRGGIISALVGIGIGSLLIWLVYSVWE
jgi:hypothetical protein